ncbi:hypothetical protein [uncultured Polaribacter sp.]|uniref:HD domain-containing protein n=1 Tax=uncultured Polaribacter sp. TaxID=174711 RepID=UPI0026210E01|nr:hypothetical protein [uncultured Polaribacter sp.]
MKSDKLYKNWIELGKKHCQDHQLLNFYWNKIKKNYSEKKRYYHNLSHIESMLLKAVENKNQLVDYDEILFAIWFHDIIYKATSKKNEEKSADFAKSTLKKITKGILNIDKVYQLIISTKSHKIILEEGNDNGFLLDFDLSILGQNWSVYKNYIQQIRKEYSMYPDFLYKPGRKKVLKHFLNRKNLFFTEKYQCLFEEKARQNLLKELNLLS